MDFLRKHRLFLAGLILAAACPSWAAEPASQPATAPTVRTAPASPLVGHSDGRGRAARDSTGVWRGLFQTAGALAVVAAIMIGLWLVLRRLRDRSVLAGGPRALAVLSRSALSMKHQVYVIRWGERLLLVGTGPQGMTVLSERPVAAEDKTTA